MMQYWSHFKYTIIHKYFVFLECCKRGIVWRGIMHDMSKFSPSEFGAYANYFFNPDGTRKTNPETGDSNQVEAFKRAWCYHAHYNDHHPSYWISIPHNSQTSLVGSNNYVVLLPNISAIKEMISDMIGASAAQGNVDPKQGAMRYYLNNKNQVILHPSARQILEMELGVNNE